MSIRMIRITTLLQRNITTLAAVSLFLGACATTPPAQDPVLIKLNELEQRLQTIERVIDNQSMVALAADVSTLQQQGDEQTGRIEKLEFEAEGSGTRLRDLYADLDQRIQNLETSAAVRKSAPVNVMDGGALQPGQLPVPGGSDRDNYQAAFELLKEQRYEPAGQAFKQFLVSYPDSALADNAQYWLAESEYVTQKFPAALAAFEIVVRDYPNSRKVPDALLKIGYCNYELKRWDVAKQALTKVQREYPDTTAARLAEQRLKRLEEEGH